MADQSDKKEEVLAVCEEFEQSKGTRIWTDYVNALKLVSQVVFTRSSGFILELIQNAEDAGLGLAEPGEIALSISTDRLKFVHNGNPFNGAHLRAICGIRSSKKPEQGTLGYLGIGFKSVFKVADCAEVYSNGFQFKFDRNHSEWSGHAGDTPWHVIPIWMDEPSEEVTPDKTTFIIKFRDNQCFQNVSDGLKQLKAELYLFLKWIKLIRVHDEVSGQSWALENAEEKGNIALLKQDSRTLRFRFYRREVIVPEEVKLDRLTQEYRSNVKKREIAIAFAVDAQGNLDPSPSTALYGGVYSFLPLGESKSGAKFPIQADFLVQPGRDAINYESSWNHWLVGEVRQLCMEAIADFQGHPLWKYQFLAMFEFKKTPGFESHDRLFGPELIDPIQKYLDEHPCVVTVDDSWARKSEVVHLTEDPIAAKALVDTGILEEHDIASVLGGKSGLKLVHPLVVARQPDAFKQVDRWSLFENEEFLKSRSEAPDAERWFLALYSWLKTHPAYEAYLYKRRYPIKGYHQRQIILTADRQLLEGGRVSLMDATITDPIITKAAIELQKTRPMLHPDILGGVKNSEDRVSLSGFLIGLCGVQKIDVKTICREALLPKIIDTADQPQLDELLTYTRYCKEHLAAELPRGIAIWALTKNCHLRMAKVLCFSTEFRPPQNWEIHQQYVKGLDFLSPRYVENCKTDAEFKAWREFFKLVGVKDTPDNGVEEFAMNYASDKLQPLFGSIEAVEKRNFGYDLQAKDASRDMVHIEVKGLSADSDVELSPNEADVAYKYGQSFYLCVVSSIPNSPIIHVIRDPASVGKKDRLTITEQDWKAGRLEM